MPSEPHPATADPTATADRTATTDRLPLRRRLLPVIALLLLAPWAAECSWGGFAIGDFLLVLLILSPMYGGAAILIRETARHLGAGWPTIVLLAAAFGVLQAGLVDQSLFNPGFLDDTQYADSRAAAEATLVPGLEFSLRQAFDYVGNHIALTICAPIVLIESFLGADRRRRPWLGRPGLVVVGLIYLLGSLLIFSDSSGRKDFVASPLQLTFAATVVLALVAAALLPRWRHRSPRPAEPGTPGRGRRAPHPLWVGVVVVLVRFGTDLTPGWPGVAIALALAAAVGGLIAYWSSRTGWGQRHVLAAGTASLVTAAAFAYLVPPYSPASPAAALAGDVAVTVITVALIGGAWWRLRRASPSVHVGAS
ncbi:hypothetical protein [Micromonospora parathelypteridis]|uniref:Uncharacterized protein n=1 Tax=Micromonospora parathelypteridis TaxID=1839617 RepID=A0A840W0J8_9ACTN|nr:hypothetical protein [Micromonospora parathelypteridis]MBB5478738.1 hypothetical protein [Micromonospora parathelypteridis]GGO04772.1 hypothetical protein GCM10011576_06680 [Micromonospora parathelypteridis]